MTSSHAPGERFRRRRFRRGYNAQDVDAFLERARLGGVTAADVREMAFATVYGGYDEVEVDDALDALAGQLTERWPGADAG